MSTTRSSRRQLPLRIDIAEWHIRNYAVRDVAALVKYANNRKVSINLRDRFPYPYKRAHAAAWIQHVKAQKPQTNFAIASDGELIGGIGLELQGDVHRLSAEIGYWLGEPYWGKGIATRAVRALTEYGFANYPLVRIFAGVFEWNPASARVLEKAGYVFEGRLRKSAIKDGKIIDQVLYAIVRP